MSEKYEIIYVLSNEAMPSLIKIGKTKRKDINERLNELYKTGVPLPFKCEWAGEVEDCNELELILHNAFSDRRINLKREFFKLEPEQVIPLLKKLCIKEITSQVETALNKDVSVEEKNAAKEYHRPMLNFEEMNIPMNAELIYTKDENIRARVISSKKITYEGEEYSLTALTKQLLNNDYNVAPCPFWTFEGKNLKNIYDETYVV